MVRSHEMDNQRIIEILKKVEPGYNSWTDIDIAKQIGAINECGYEWFEENGKVGFKHTESGIYLKIEGLNYYSPEEIKKTYEKVWSKSFDKVRKRDKKNKFFIKFIKSLILTLLSLITFLFIDREVASGISIVLALITVYYYLNFKRLLHQIRLANGFYERQKNQNST